MASTAPRPAACVLGQQITVRGTLTGEEDLVVEGRVEGSLALAGHLIVAESGVLEADIDVQSIEVHGEVRGNIVASESITDNLPSACLRAWNGELQVEINTKQFVDEPGGRVAVPERAFGVKSVS